jgi:FMN phosphatase YigB (HAD superfamily)
MIITMSRMRRPRAIFIDLDATILDYDDDSWSATVTEVCRLLEVETPDLVAEPRIDLRFDAIVTSGEVGVAKPDARIFEIAARLLGVPTAAAWHVGDSLSTDVAGAHNAGLAAAIWLNRTRRPSDGAAPRPHREINSLCDLVALL